MIDFKNGSFLKLKKQNLLTHEIAIAPLLIEGETFIGEYQGIRDYVVFTNKRIITVNIQGITGRKKDYTSIPYSKIQAFSVETAGSFDMDSELEICLSGVGRVRLEFTGKSDILQIGRYISEYVL